MSSQAVSFHGPSALNPHEQISLLRKRGLVLPNPERTLHYLKFIGYYRLSGYFPPFLDSSGKFQKNTSFDQVLNYYIFDRKLRLLVMDAVERIEVAVRTTISNTLCVQHDEYWYQNSALFIHGYNHHQLLKIVREKTNTFPPSWKVAEELSFGVWSKIFSNLKSRELQKEICKPYSIDYTIMTSWLRSFTYLRNLCAHHERLWNRTFTVKPKVLKKYRKHFINNSKFYSQAAVLNVFLDVIADGSGWQQRLSDLIDQNKEIPLQNMGFHSGWSSDPFWGINR
ncbi:MAG: Abi family protein [Candidatus Electrothrix communis]|nr:MAG: Abi family protein [Candidatus Electrothrix communis]